MPSDRPLRMHCFIERDDEYYKELERLKNAVVMGTANYQWDLNTENAATLAVRSGKVTREEIQVTQLYGSRFLIVLPPGLAPETFINATPQSAWDEGITFQPWSPLDDAAISVPAYKVLVGLSGIPPHLWREKNVEQTVNKFGLYLGSVQPEDVASITTFIAAVAVDDLSLVPQQMTMHAGGMVYTIDVHTITWERTPLYTAAEMPRLPERYTRPQPQPDSSSSDDEPATDDHEPVLMSRTVLRELCRGRTADSLPPELRPFASLEVIAMEDPHVDAHTIATQDPPAADQGTDLLTQNGRLENIQVQDRMGNNGSTVNEAGLKTPTILARTTFLAHNRSGPESSLVMLPKVTSFQLTRGTHQQNRSGTVQCRQAEAGKMGGSAVQTIHPHTESTTNKLKRILISGDKLLLRDSSGNNFKGGDSRVGRVSTHKDKGDQPARKDKGPLLDQSIEAATVGPNSGDLTLKQIQRSVRQKRKTHTSGLLGSTKKKNAGGASGSGSGPLVSFDPTGHFQFKVDAGHVINLASGCGFRVKDVEDIIQKDNAARQQPQAGVHLDPGTSSASARTDLPPIGNEEDEEEDDYDLSRFDLDPNDVLSSEEE